ncbi:hypothetical protein HOT75_gp128 [Gordonia phage Daredevil]|uniref:Immunity repressor n=1 Tax=Gordonia phage Daredevil TaxID=2283286 RepID=A0A345MIY4_9CAUD|nr:hypothetical protein HOT75_gp128 [Gordonia phage Daredevil]AXH70515.1 hypothetical protein SEA_DAREDEVIL_128 [Gordonia phage Daredevil]
MKKQKRLEELIGQAVGRDVPAAELASRLGVARQTWANRLARNEGMPVAEDVIELARSYGLNPITALLYCGHVTPREVGQSLTKQQRAYWSGKKPKWGADDTDEQSTSEVEEDAADD